MTGPSLLDDALASPRRAEPPLAALALRVLSALQTGRRSSIPWRLSLALLALGCGSRATVPAGAEDAGPPLPGASVEHTSPEAAPEHEVAVPLADVRLIRAFPARYLGKVVDCDAQDVGPLREAPADDLRLRALGLSHTRTVRCSAGFVQLAFRPSSSALAAFIRPHRRLRVRVRDTGAQRWSTPIMEFVAQADDDLEDTVAPASLFTPLAVGDDLRPAAIGAAGGGPRACVIAWVGGPRPLPVDPDLDPPDPTFSLPVSCHHATGDAWVELQVRAARVEAMIARVRGERLSLRIISLAGGRGGYPMATLAD